MGTPPPPPPPHYHHHHHCGSIYLQLHLPGARSLVQAANLEVRASRPSRVPTINQLISTEKHVFEPMTWPNRDITDINTIPQRTWNGSSRLWQRTYFPAGHHHHKPSNKSAPSRAPPLTVFICLHHGRNVRLGLHFHPDMHPLPAPGRTPQHSVFAGQPVRSSLLPYPPRPQGMARSGGRLLPRRLPPAQSLPPDRCSAPHCPLPRRSSEALLALPQQHSRPGPVPDQVVSGCARGRDQAGECQGLLPVGVLEHRRA